MIKKLYDRIRGRRDKRRSTLTPALTRKSAVILGVGAGVHWHGKYRKSTRRKKPIEPLSKNLLSIT